MNKFKQLCMNCMREIKTSQACPYCGYVSAKDIDVCYLRPGYVLQNKYLVGNKRDENSEGIGYIGYDIHNENIVYIREFMPEKFCLRADDVKTIEVIPSYEELYNSFLDKFLCYARSVAKLRDVYAVITIYDIFQENNTAYYIADFPEGTSFKEFVEKNGGKVSWDVIRPLFMPALSAMSNLHKHGIMHLGLCPENLLVTNDQKLKICGFSINEVRQYNAILVPELFDGYSAPEQYIIREKLTESADVYAFCACMLFAMSGKQPPIAHNRTLDSKLLISKNVLDSMPKCVVSSIADGLKVPVSERTHTFDQLRNNLSPIKELIDKDSTKEKSNQNTKKSKVSIYYIIVSCMIVLILLLVFGIFSIGTKNIKNTSSYASSSSAADSSNSSSSTDKDLLQVVVPDLSGVLLKDAQKAANSNGEYEVLLSEEEFSDTIVSGRIISQTPAVGTLMKKGSVIAVNVSKGSKIRKLPEIKNLTLSVASSKISLAGFVPKKEEQFDDFVASGLVIDYKDYTAGDQLEYGTEVTIVVSKGKKE